MLLYVKIYVQQYFFLLFLFKFEIDLSEYML